MTAETFRCAFCGLTYRDPALARRCYAWCVAHGACNLAIARRSVEAQESRDG